MRPRAVLAGLFALIAAVCVVIWFNNTGRSLSVAELPPGTEVGEPVNGMYPANPFTGETPDPAPRVEIEERAYEFERMAIGDSQSHQFLVRNIGEGVLRLAQGDTTCKCTVGNLGQNEVPPGETVEVELTWHPTGADPMFSQSAKIYTNDPETPQFDLMVRGTVADRIATYPSGPWTSSTVSESRETPFEFVIASQLDESFEITGIEPSTDLIEFDVTPISAEELEQYQSALSGYQISGRLLLGFPIGDIREHLIVSTDIEQQPEIRLGIETARLGPYHVVGPGWMAATRRLRMGRFDAADGKIVRISFFVEEEGDEFQFTDVIVAPEILDVSWEVDATFESPTRKRIWIEVAAAPGITPGRWDAEESVKVTLLTNDPEHAEWPLSVALQAD